MKKVTKMAALFIVSAMVLVACGGETKEQTEEVQPEVSTAIEETKEEVKEVAEEVKVETQEAATKVEEKVEEVKAEVKEVKSGSLKDKMGANDEGGSKLKDKMTTTDAATGEATSGGKLKDKMKK
jgi:F0F1-type ATP synthase membrane subunit b/b'